jgi:hypothetical protein
MRQLLPTFPGNGQQWLDTMAADGEDGQLYFHPKKKLNGKKNWKGIGNGFQERETPAGSLTAEPARIRLTISQFHLIFYL